MKDKDFNQRIHLGRVNLIKDLGPGGVCCGGLAQSGRGRQNGWTFELRGEGDSQPARQRGLRGGGSECKGPR